MDIGSDIYYIVACENDFFAYHSHLQAWFSIGLIGDCTEDAQPSHQEAVRNPMTRNPQEWEMWCAKV